MMPSTACVSSLFVTSTDSGSRSGNPFKRSRSPAVRRARLVEEHQETQVQKRHLGHPPHFIRFCTSDKSERATLPQLCQSLPPSVCRVVHNVSPLLGSTRWIYQLEVLIGAATAVPVAVFPVAVAVPVAITPSTVSRWLSTRTRSAFNRSVTTCQWFHFLSS